MSQLDLLAQLREARPIAPAELREHIRAHRGRGDRAEADRDMAAGVRGRRPARRRDRGRGDPPARREAAPRAHRLSSAQPCNPTATTPHATRLHRRGAPEPNERARAGDLRNSRIGCRHERRAAQPFPAPSPDRIQRITTVTRASRPEHAGRLRRHEEGRRDRPRTRRLPLVAQRPGRRAKGYADITLRIPKQNVQRAVSRLSALGTIVGENVAIKDITVQVDATARKIARLETRLAYWQAQPASDEAAGHVAALTAQIAKLKRGRAATIHTASFATVNLELTTRPAPPPPCRRAPARSTASASRSTGSGSAPSTHSRSAARCCSCSASPGSQHAPFAGTARTRFSASPSSFPASDAGSRCPG